MGGVVEPRRRSVVGTQANGEPRGVVGIVDLSAFVVARTELFCDCEVVQLWREAITTRR